MLEIKTRKQLSEEAFRLAESFNLVQYQHQTYIPVDFETGVPDPSAPPNRTVWLPLSQADIAELAKSQFSTLFSSDTELRNFEFMVGNSSKAVRWARPVLLIKTVDGLRVLNEDGELEDVTGEFIPNCLLPTLNQDQEAKDEIYRIISEWLDSEEEAQSLLHHMATILSPAYSPVRYVLLIGNGRNGKSLLLEMLIHLIGDHNTSAVSRQIMAKQDSTVAELNGKLLNVVMDGESEFLKASGWEKSLIAGEKVPVRLLYKSTVTPTSSNCLFIEGLQKEPKTTDKSSALQKRITRFWFPNTYKLDHKFRRKMLSEEMLGAFLGLLIDYFVKEEEVYEKLAPTAKSKLMQLEFMHTNSLALQFIEWYENTDALGMSALIGENSDQLVQSFISWRVKEGDLTSWAAPDVLAQFRPFINTDRNKTVRVNGKPRKIRVITGFTEELLEFLDSMGGEEDAGAEDPGPAVVEN